MNLLALLRSRFAAVLTDYVADPSELVEMVRRSGDAKFGDYQANVAMPLGKQLGRPPRDVANEIVAKLQIDDLCEPPEVAGPGFINLKLKDDFLRRQVQAAVGDERLGIARAEKPRTFVIDYSAPNVAKPMHVGHIRSTVIGDALKRVLRFKGHKVIGDNHIGDWGTQFGMILYGYKHFVDRAALEKDPVHELARLYRLVNQFVEYHEGRHSLPRLEQDLAAQRAALEQEQRLATSLEATDEKAAKKAHKDAKRQEGRLKEAAGELAALKQKLAEVDNSPELSQLAANHADIGPRVLEETAKLHADDPENLRLWREFLPSCLAEIDHIYQRLGVTFDVTLGESFYHDRLAAVVDDLLKQGIAIESDGAICVFNEGQDAPLIIRKKDGAFLYGTSDLATIQYRRETWSPDAMLYVVDHRQSLHFEHLFAAARKWGYANVELKHVAFGTVMGEDGKPYKTRSGSTVGLEGLLEEAVSRAYQIVSDNDDAKPDGPELSEPDRRRVAKVVGIGALKYADLMHNRTSDYVFSYEKMLATTGNTATYLQYAYARVRSIFRKGGVDIVSARSRPAEITLDHPAERALALEILALPEALDEVVADYRPNQLTAYLFDRLAKSFSTFFEHCPVLKAESESLRASRLLLCDLTARTLELGLKLLGIEVVEQM